MGNTQDYVMKTAQGSACSAKPKRLHTHGSRICEKRILRILGY